MIVRADTEGNLNIWDVKTKSSRNISTKRGFIKKIRFAPGRGNMKLLVLHVDTVSIWDVKEAEVINELRSPKDLVSKPIDIEWAASDRPVVASSDGSIRILSLALSLSTSSGPLEATSLTTPCFGLLPNKIKQNITMMLHHQPWNDDFSLEPEGGLNTSESKLFFGKFIAKGKVIWSSSSLFTRFHWRRFSVRFGQRQGQRWLHCAHDLAMLLFLLSHFPFPNVRAFF